MTSPDPNTHCVVCGAEAAATAGLFSGQSGAVCRGCIWSLSARLTEDDSDAPDPLAVRASGEEFSAHDYPSRIDLATAYIEMGRRGAALVELAGAAEAAFFCGDHKAGMSVLAQILRLADSPRLRDRVCEMIVRLAPEDEGSS